jgi:hypothetical protein
MSTFAKKVTSAVAGLAIVFSVVSPIAGVSAAFSGLEAAQELATLAIIEDQSANPADYRLGDSSSREELSKVISKLAGLTADSSDSVYLDTDFASWSEKYAKALNEAGIAASNTYFNPKDMTSKIEALKWVMEARDIATGTGADWMEARVNGAVAAGIATSFSDYNAEATRGQVFIWAAEAIAADAVVVEETNPLCELLGICEEEEEVVVVEPTTPVVEGSAMISLSPESPSNGLAAVNTPRVSMLAFDVTAGATDVTLEQITLYHVGLGDRTNVDDITVYNSINESVSKTKSFSDNDLDISFDRDVVVQAGETQTFTIAATLTDTGDANTTYQIELSSLEASAAVSGAGIVGAALTPTVVANSGELSVSDDTASEDITIGEEVTLAGFSIEENNDNEDVLIKTITLHQNGSIDPDYLEDLVLEADGVVVATGMMVNSDDELVMNIDYVLAADDEVEFELMGTISGDVGESVHFEFEGTDDVYATGVSTGFNIGFNVGDEPQTADVASIEVVEGAEIDAVFDKSDVDETKVDVDDVLVGTLELTANSNDYEVTKIEVTVTGTAGTAAIDDLYLDGQSFDDLTGNVYTFEDIVLTQGVTEVLPLEFDVNESILLNGQDVIFSVKITEIEDDENNITYTDGGTDDVSDVLSTNAFDTQSIDIETASFELTQTSVNDRELVLANGAETVLYKAKISVGDSDDVSIEDFDLVLTAGSTLSVDLDDIMDSATLNIGGTTYDADIDSNSVDFTSINHIVAAGSDNVELLVTAVLQDDDAIGLLETVTLELLAANIELEDSDNEDITGANKVITTGTKDTTTTLREEGTFEVRVINEVDTDDTLENTVLAGNSSVVLAELEMEAEYEDMDVDTLEFTITGDFADTLNDVRIVNGSTVVADGAIVTSDGVTTTIKFEDFTVADDDDLIEGDLVADLSTFTGEGDETSAQLGAIAISLITGTLDIDGADSNNTITADTTGTVAGETVTVVPTLLVFSVVESLSSGQAKVKITADSGNNTVGTSNETPEVLLNSLTFTDLASSLGGYIVYKDGEAATQGSMAAGTGAKPVTFGAVDVTFDNSQTYVIVPAATVDATYSLVLSGLVANYDVQDSSGTTVVGGAGLTTTLESDVSVGSKTY